MNSMLMRERVGMGIRLVLDIRYRARQERRWLKCRTRNCSVVRRKKRRIWRYYCVCWTFYV